jgi:hypothetical protein
LQINNGAENQLDEKDNFGQTAEELARAREPPAELTARYLAYVRSHQSTFWYESSLS